MEVLRANQNSKSADEETRMHKNTNIIPPACLSSMVQYRKINAKLSSHCTKIQYSKVRKVTWTFGDPTSTVSIFQFLITILLYRLLKQRYLGVSRYKEIPANHNLRSIDAMISKYKKNGKADIIKRTNTLVQPKRKEN